VSLEAPDLPPDADISNKLSLEMVRALLEYAHW
jgi:hypothetical protein